jgi:hypothetical protein
MVDTCAHAVVVCAAQQHTEGMGRRVDGQHIDVVDEARSVIERAVLGDGASA